MANVTLMGASFEDVPAVTLPKTGGGTASFFDMDTNIAYLGVNAEWVKEIMPTTAYKLQDTLYASWTASTTAKAIVATANKGTFTADMDNYEYILRWRFKFVRTGTSGATLKAVPDVECNDLYQVVMKRPNSLSTIASDSFAGNACLTLLTTPLLVYYNTSGARTYTFATSYGFYLGATAATFSNATSDTPTVTMKTPTINARCNSTYFATGRAGEIDQTVESMWLRGDLYRVRTGSFVRGAYGGLIDIYNNGI